ncbi:MAG: hypothetical protein RML12_10860 [Xanthomonadales bacterium]|nr:hypothetical protein [Xanthomonadales bacterium]
MSELLVLKWVHILAMVYWLGGEWGVFQTSYKVIDRRLSLEERRRHMDTAYKIDILARTGIILLLPLGLHMGVLWSIVPRVEGFLPLVWLLTAAWLGLCWAAFVHRETDRGIRLTKIDEGVRFVLIPALLAVALSSLAGYGPFRAGPGLNWYAAKVLVYAGLLVIGLKLRFIMREWTVMFRRLDAEGPVPEVEARLERSIRVGRTLAYFYWVGIASVCFLGTVKPF